LNKFQAGDWVYNETYGVGKVMVAVFQRYTIKFNGVEWRSVQLQEEELTKIEHSLRPGHKVQFESRGTYYHGTVTSINPYYVDIEREGIHGKYTRYHTKVTKLADTLPKSDLPLPPKLDTLKQKTVTTTFTDVDPEVMKIVFGVDLALPKDSLAIRETKGYLDAKIKRAELDLKKQQEDLAKLREARAKL
jgi:hypothetical protein